MLKDIRIYCTGYLWNEAVVGRDLYKINFFYVNNNTAGYAPFTDRLEISQYIIENSCSDISWEQDRTRRPNQYFRVPSDFSFEVTDIVLFLTTLYGTSSMYKMRDFTQILSDSTYIKYLIEIEYYINSQWIPLAQFFVNQSAIREAIKRAKDSHKISIQCLGMEKEMKDYFSAKKLHEYNYNDWESFGNYGVPMEDGSTHYVKKMGLQSLLTKLFRTTPSSGFRLDVYPPNISTHEGINSIFDYKNTAGTWIHTAPFVVDLPFLIRFNSTKLMLFAHGLEKSINDGNTVWDWFNKVCDSYGWVYSIIYKAGYGSTKAFLNIRNRYETNRSIRTINRTNLLNNYELGKTDASVRFPIVLLGNGFMDYAPMFKEMFKVMGEVYYETGVRCFVFNKYRDNVLYADSFSDIERNVQGHLIPLAGDYQGAYGLDGSRLVYRDYHVATGHNDYETFQNADVLAIDGGTLRTTWRCNLFNGKNEDTETIRDNYYDITFSGNYGNMVGCENVYEPAGNIYYSYRDWVKGRTHIPGFYHRNFFNNFKCLLNTRTTNCNPTISLNEILLDMNTTFKFASELNLYESSMEFSIAKMKWNLYNKTTELNLLNL